MCGCVRELSRSSESRDLRNEWILREEFAQEMLCIVQRFGFATLADAKHRDHTLFKAAFLQALVSVAPDVRDHMVSTLQTRAHR